MQLMELRRAAGDYANRDGRVAEGEYFFAEQNARLVRNAELSCVMFAPGQVESWNQRDTHMMETLDALLAWTTSRWDRQCRRLGAQLARILAMPARCRWGNGAN